MIKPIEKIKSLLSDDIVTLFGNDTINVAYVNSYKVVNNLITSESCLDSILSSGLDTSNYLTSHTSESVLISLTSFYRAGFLDNRRLLLVERHNSTGIDAAQIDNKYYKCIKLNTKNVSQATNHNSIYYENDVYNPKFHHTDDGSIVVLPKNKVVDVGTVLPKGRVYWLTFPDFNTSDSSLEFTFNLSGKNFSEITKDQESELFYGIPGGAKELLYIEMALNLLQNYMSDFVYNEEDTELVGLTKDHAAALMAKKNEELGYVLAKYGNVKDKK